MHVLYKAHVKDKKVVAGSIESDSYYKDKNYVLTFNQHGMILIEDSYGSDGEEIKVYDDAGKKLSEVKYDEERKIYQTTTYSYDDKGKPLGNTTLDRNGDTLNKTVYRYDEK